jgi:hypothetical protein
MIMIRMPLEIVEYQLALEEKGVNRRLLIILDLELMNKTRTQ